jgi:hypothetical protein
MDPEFRSFLYRLADDSDLLVRYREDPEAVMLEAHLTDEQQEVLRSGDPTRLTEHAGIPLPPIIIVPGG